MLPSPKKASENAVVAAALDLVFTQVAIDSEETLFKLTNEAGRRLTATLMREFPSLEPNTAINMTTFLITERYNKNRLRF